MKESLKTISRETEEALAIYASLLIKWNKKINLIGKSTEEKIWERHINDALQICSAIPQTSKNLLDIGSGAGIPGLIIAIAMPQLKVTLVESDQKKCAFLVEARRVVGCKNVEILADRVESIEGTWDVITARAVTKLKELLFWKSLVGHKNTVGLWLKGKEWREELEDAKTMFVFDSVITPSITETNSVLITTKSSQLKAG